MSPVKQGRGKKSRKTVGAGRRTSSTAHSRKKGTNKARSSRKSARTPAAATVAASDLSLRAHRIKLLLLDVDGVLTDGGIYYSEGGTESKRFHIQDGMGIDMLQRAGIKVGILTGRRSGIVERRARELGIDLIKQGFYDKSVGFAEILEDEQLTPAEVGYIGDDVQDLSVMRLVGFRAAPANAVEELKAVVQVVAEKSGGHGAVREIADLILKLRDAKERVVAEVSSPGVSPPSGRAAGPVAASLARRR